MVSYTNDQSRRLWDPEPQGTGEAPAAPRAGRDSAREREPVPGQAGQACGGRWPGRRAGMGSRNSSRFPLGSWL